MGEGRLLAERSGALKARGGRSDQQPVARPRALLDLSLLGDLERIVDLYAEVSNGAFELAMSKQKLNRSEVLLPLANQSRLRPTDRVCAVSGRIRGDLPSVLSR